MTTSKKVESNFSGGGDKRCMSITEQYQRVAIKISDHFDLPDELKEAVDLFDSVCCLSDEFIVISVSKIV
ncbi:unnamed protein product [Rotaria magnacalcarata]|uniref:Uncharacterized protein n=1 Tax=Rotaria magnacalcarata TaxID=392030 RepID=A0A819W0B7_9BILA|nr:unnamed protein product [Rotaria magnacalcarata]CAF4168053.1 unnamed protein product [Rotaria magnacalcarata]